MSRYVHYGVGRDGKTRLGSRTRRTTKQRMASKRNLIKARKVRAHDTLTHYARKGLTAVGSKATLGLHAIFREK